jgi:hypothetical protein
VSGGWPRRWDFWTTNRKHSGIIVRLFGNGQGRKASPVTSRVSSVEQIFQIAEDSVACICLNKIPCSAPVVPRKWLMPKPENGAVCIARKHLCFAKDLSDWLKSGLYGRRLGPRKSVAMQPRQSRKIGERQIQPLAHPVRR